MKWLAAIFQAFFCDSKTKVFVPDKFWQNLGFSVATYVIILQAAKISVELFTAYMIVVGGNHALIFWLRQRNQDGPPPPCN